MTQIFPKRYYFFFALLAIISGIAIFWATKEIVEKEKTTRAIRLERANKTAALEFKEAISTYATLLTGLKTDIELHHSKPIEDEVKKFLKHQLNDLYLEAPFSVSYVDTNHIFQFDFTKDGVPDVKLEGTSIKAIIGEKGIQRMDTLMLSNSFYASNPTNLIEGRAGLPLGFGVIDSTGLSMGYITSVAELMPIMERVYSHFDTEDFVCKFHSDEGIYFDKTRAYNNQKVYAKEKDPEYYKNFDVPDDAYVSTIIPFYNKEFTISTAYKEPFKYRAGLFITSVFWYLLVLGFMFFIISQLYVYKRKNKIINAQKQQLTELVATKNKFFSIIAHDLRSPLSSVVNFLDILKLEKPDSAMNTQIVKALGDSSKNSLSLLDNLLKWSKVQTGNIKYDPTATDLMKIVQDQISVQQHHSDKKKIKIVLESSFDGKIIADKNMVATVVRNLLSNAIKFSKEKSIIVVEISKQKNFASVSIEDNGIGIPKSYLEKLFDVTEVTTQRGTDNEKGSGLGLILCKQFIEMHGGKLILESTEGKGTIASFTLPL